MLMIHSAPREVLLLRHRAFDLRLREQVLKALRATGYPSLFRLRCEVEDGIVELQGEASTFYLKQLAQSTALRVPQIRGVTNLIEVL